MIYQLIYKSFVNEEAAKEISKCIEQNLKEALTKSAYQDFVEFAAREYPKNGYSLWTLRDKYKQWLRRHNNGYEN